MERPHPANHRSRRMEEGAIVALGSGVQRGRGCQAAACLETRLQQDSVRPAKRQLCVHVGGRGRTSGRGGAKVGGAGHT